MNEETRSPEPGSRPRFEWTRWKVTTFSIAGLLIVAGLGLAFVGGGEEPAGITTAPVAGGGPGPAGNSLLPGSTPSSTPDSGETEEAPPPDAGDGSDVAWSPAMVRGGISFFAAFALAYALRSFLRLALIIAGIWFAVLFYLSWLGWVTVHWDVIDTAFRAWTATIGDQFRSVQTFITGSLPSAGMAGLGLYTGFRRK